MKIQDGSGCNMNNYKHRKRPLQPPVVTCSPALCGDLSFRETEHPLFGDVWEGHAANARGVRFLLGGTVVQTKYNFS